MRYGFRGVKVFALPGSEELAKKVCGQLNKKLPQSLKPKKGLKLAKVKVVKFDNENVQVQIENVRGYFVVVVHTQATPGVNEELVALFALLDAIKNSNAADLLVVFPYMPYARSDRKDQPRISVMSVVIAQILNRVSGVKRVLLLDPHDTHVKHYFEPSADEISTIYLYADLMLQYIKTRLKGKTKDVLICYSDGGAAKRFIKLHEITKLAYDYIDKARTDNKGGLKIQKGINAAGKICFMVDDELCSGGTAKADAEALKKSGAKKIIMFSPHAPLVKKGKTARELVAMLEDSPISEFAFTDSIPVNAKLKGMKKFTVLSVAGLLALGIKHTVTNTSVTSLHDPKNVRLYRPPYPRKK